MTKSDTASELVFVYGTLRRGASNACRMAGAEFMGRAVVAGDLYRIDWYPGLVTGGCGRVVGEIYRVDEGALRELDRYEGIPEGESEGQEYRKVRVEAVLDGAGSREVLVYEWKGMTDAASRIPDGDWLGSH